MFILSIFAIGSILSVAQCNLQLQGPENKFKDDNRWLHIHENIVDVYGNILQTLFTKYPEYMNQFSFGVVPISELFHNWDFKYHIKKSLGFLEVVFRALDKVDIIYDIVKETVDIVRNATSFLSVNVKKSNSDLINDVLKSSNLVANIRKPFPMLRNSEKQHVHQNVQAPLKNAPVRGSNLTANTPNPVPEIAQNRKSLNISLVQDSNLMTNIRSTSKTLDDSTVLEIAQNNKASVNISLVRGSNLMTNIQNTSNIPLNLPNDLELSKIDHNSQDTLNPVPEISQISQDALNPVPQISQISQGTLNPVPQISQNSKAILHKFLVERYNLITKIFNTSNIQNDLRVPKVTQNFQGTLNPVPQISQNSKANLHNFLVRRYNLITEIVNTSNKLNDLAVPKIVQNIPPSLPDVQVRDSDVATALYSVPKIIEDSKDFPLNSQVGNGNSKYIESNNAQDIQAAVEDSIVRGSNLATNIAQNSKDAVKQSVDEGIKFLKNGRNPSKVSNDSMLPKIAQDILAALDDSTVQGSNFATNSMKPVSKIAQNSKDAVKQSVDEGINFLKNVPNPFEVINDSTVPKIAQNIHAALDDSTVLDSKYGELATHTVNPNIQVSLKNSPVDDTNLATDIPNLPNTLNFANPLSKFKKVLQKMRGDLEPLFEDNKLATKNPSDQSSESIPNNTEAGGVDFQTEMKVSYWAQ